MGAWISDAALHRRREFIDYIHGLIRYEVHQGEDNDIRLELLSKIYHDLLYVENLEMAANWKRKEKAKDDLSLALDKIKELTRQLNEMKANLQKVLSYIEGAKTKKEITELINELSKEVA